MTVSRSIVALMALIGSMAISAPALAEPLEPYLERSAVATFAGEQVISCNTPDGSRAAAVELVHVDGITTVRPAAGGAGEVRVAKGSFAVMTGGGSVGTSAVTAASLPTGQYLVSLVEQVEALGRPAQRLTVVDAAGLDRASMAFDDATGALVEATILNDDGSTYCEIRMVDLLDTPTPPAVDAAASSLTLRAVEPASGLPEEVAGFSRVESFGWDRDGVVSYYSDGLFSFALLATPRPLVLDAATAAPVTLDGGDYVRWYGAGQSIHIWDSPVGGLAMYGDLPLDLQQRVLSELPRPEMIGILSRWWRNLFG